jgi:hypothetical protein
MKLPAVRRRRDLRPPHQTPRRPRCCTKAITSPPRRHRRQFQVCFCTCTANLSVPPHTGHGPTNSLPRRRSLIPRRWISWSIGTACAWDTTSSSRRPVILGLNRYCRLRSTLPVQLYGPTISWSSAARRRSEERAWFLRVMLPHSPSRLATAAPNSLMARSISWRMISSDCLTSFRFNSVPGHRDLFHPNM